MALNTGEMAELYRKRARNYDITANLYYLLGIREFAYRRKPIQLLNLKRGDTVVEIGCGTGLNFKLLRERVGPEGRIIGVDLTFEMLARALHRINTKGWNNVELEYCDAAKFHFPKSVNGIVSSFALTLVPEYDQVIQHGAASLTESGRFVILDFKEPDNWPTWLVDFFVMITRPFGVSLDMADRHPWESIGRYLNTVQHTELYGGVLYICAGEAI